MSRTRSSSDMSKAAARPWSSPSQVGSPKRREQPPMIVEQRPGSREKDTGAWCSDGRRRRHDRAVEIPSAAVLHELGGLPRPLGGIGAQADDDPAVDRLSRGVQHGVDRIVVDDVDQRELARRDGLALDLPRTLAPRARRPSAFDSVRFHTVVRCLASSNAAESAWPIGPSPRTVTAVMPPPPGA